VGIKGRVLRPIYLISKTPSPGVNHIPILKTRFFTPEIQFDRYDGLIVTSKQIFKALEPYPQSWKKLPIIAVSEQTAEIFRSAGCNVVGVANGYGNGVIPIVSEQFREYRWLYLRPSLVATSWAEEIASAGVNIDEAVLYETECNEEIEGEQIAKDAVLIFTSPSSIACFMRHHELVETQTIVVIGKTTQNALPKGVESYVSTETSIASVVEKAYELAKISSPF
jgi:uroporphyrinogen-III synthase